MNDKAGDGVGPRWGDGVFGFTVLLLGCWPPNNSVLKFFKRSAFTLLMFGGGDCVCDCVPKTNVGVGVVELVLELNGFCWEGGVGLRNFTVSDL